MQYQAVLATTLIAGRLKSAIDQNPIFPIPRCPVETKQMREAIRSRVHQISARDHFAGFVTGRNVFSRQTNCIALTHRKPYITVTAFIARRIDYYNAQIAVTLLIVC